MLAHDRQQPPPHAAAAARFALGIRSRRDILRTLYYATKNGADEAWAFHRKLQALAPRAALNSGPLGMSPLNGFIVSVGDVLPRHEALNGQRAAEASAQDSACALMLILDYSIQRLRDEVAPLDTRDVGHEIQPGIKLNKAIWALANQARHAHKWLTCADAQLYAQEDVQTLVALRHDPRNLNAARELLLVGMHLSAYLTLEDMLIETAREILAPTGWKLGMVSAANVRLDPPEIAPHKS